MLEQRKAASGAHGHSHSRGRSVADGALTPDASAIPHAHGSEKETANVAELLHLLREGRDPSSWAGLHRSTRSAPEVLRQLAAQLRAAGGGAGIDLSRVEIDYTTEAVPTVEDAIAIFTRFAKGDASQVYHHTGTHKRGSSALGSPSSSGYSTPTGGGSGSARGGGGGMRAGSSFTVGGGGGSGGSPRVDYDGEAIAAATAALLAAVGASDLAPATGGAGASPGEAAAATAASGAAAAAGGGSADAAASTSASSATTPATTPASASAASSPALVASTSAAAEDRKSVV